MRCPHLLAAVTLLTACVLVTAEDKVAPDKALIVVKLPADATLTLNGEKTSATGAERRFSASGLKKENRYSYVLVATWTENGKQRKEEKKVSFNAGETVQVVFTATKATKGYTSREGRFTADMPGKVVPSTEDLGGGRKRFIFSAPAKDRNHQVSYMDFSAKTVEGKDPIALLKAFRSGYREGKKFEGEKKIELGKDKVPGIEYRLDAGDGVFIRERLYLASNRLYTVFVASVKDKDFLTSKDADRFFDSFKITK
jgi:uncharacterized protein (TIGR03000 family)